MGRGLLAALLLAVASPLAAAQEHGAGRQHVQVTPAVPPAKVAAAVAQALREAEAAAAKRAARSPANATPSRRVPAAAPPQRRYEVSWPTQRMVVHWPGGAGDRVTLTWPDSF